MTQEDKNLLLKDLCARLPYGVKIQDYQKLGEYALLKQVDFRRKQITVETDIGSFESIDFYKLEWSLPYLRSMSSMTEKDMDNLNRYVGGDRFIFENGVISVEQNFYQEGHLYSDHEDYVDIIDWLNEHHFDYRGLIKKGLALEAPKGMYKTE